MCLAIPVKIISRNQKSAQVEMEGNTTTVDVSLVPDAQVGDYVIVHAGLAIQIYDEQEALATLDLFRELNQVLQQDEQQRDKNL